MKKQSNLPSHSELRKALTESLFNPKIPGPLSTIIEESNPEYLESRAIECIKTAKINLGPLPSNPNDLQLQQYDNEITKAISLLALAKLKRTKKKQ